MQIQKNTNKFRFSDCFSRESSACIEVDDTVPLWHGMKIMPMGDILRKFTLECLINVVRNGNLRLKNRVVQLPSHEEGVVIGSAYHLLVGQVQFSTRGFCCLGDRLLWECRWILVHDFELRELHSSSFGDAKSWLVDLLDYEIPPLFIYVASICNGWVRLTYWRNWTVSSIMEMWLDFDEERVYRFPSVLCLECCLLLRDVARGYLIFEKKYKARQHRNVIGTRKR